MQRTVSAIIVDDEKNSRAVLRSLLREYVSEVFVAGEAADVASAYALVNEIHPQLVFLDIQMPGGSGFKLLKQWDEVPFDVIFVTSFDQYAVNAIKCSALDYLLKPVEVDDLKLAVKKAIKNIEKKLNLQPQLVAFLDNMDEDARNRKIAIHIHDKVKLLDINRIEYIEADDSYSHIKMATGESYVTAKYLKSFEDMLGDNKDFVRIHKSCMINIVHIKEYTKGEPCIIEMEDGRQFEVARRKKQEILERLRK